MKRPENKKDFNADPSAINITATLCEPKLLKKLIERLAFRHHQNDIPENPQPGWQSFDSSSIEAYVSGDIHLATQTDLIHMPFTKSFLFTCIRVKKEDYVLTWCSSLS